MMSATGREMQWPRVRVRWAGLEHHEVSHRMHLGGKISAVSIGAAPSQRSPKIPHLCTPLPPFLSPSSSSHIPFSSSLTTLYLLLFSSFSSALHFLIPSPSLPPPPPSAPSLTPFLTLPLNPGLVTQEMMPEMHGAFCNDTHTDRHTLTHMHNVKQAPEGAGLQDCS